MAIRSDGGPQFRSEEFNDWCRAMAIKHETSSSYYPQSNGLAEAGVKATKYLLAKCLHTGEDFNAALLEYRNTPRADGYSPAQMFFGRRQRTRLPTLDAHHEPVDSAAAAYAREQTMLEAKEYFDRRAKPLQPLQPGALVWVQDPHTKRWTDTAAVVEARESGASYIIESLDTGRQSIRNRTHIRPKMGTVECAIAATNEVREEKEEFQPRRSERLAAKARGIAQFPLERQATTSTASSVRTSQWCSTPTTSTRTAMTSTSATTRAIASSATRVEGSTSSRSTSGPWATPQAPSSSWSCLPSSSTSVSASTRPGPSAGATATASCEPSSGAYAGSYRAEGPDLW